LCAPQEPARPCNEKPTSLDTRRPSDRCQADDLSPGPRWFVTTQPTSHVSQSVCLAVVSSLEETVNVAQTHSRAANTVTQPGAPTPECSEACTSGVPEVEAWPGSDHTFSWPMLRLSTRRLLVARSSARRILSLLWPALMQYLSSSQPAQVVHGLTS